jgi:hypothetical protein
MLTGIRILYVGKDRNADIRRIVNKIRGQPILMVTDSSSEYEYLMINLLDWTRLKTSEIPFHPIESSLAELTEYSLGLLTGTAENKEISLELLNLNTKAGEGSQVINQSGDHRVRELIFRPSTILFSNTNLLTRLTGIFSK